MRRLTKEMREFEPLLLRNGYKLVRCHGSHFVYMNRNTHRIIPMNKDLNRMVRERLIKEYNLMEA